MEEKKFMSMLMLLVPQVVHLICENTGTDELTASKEFYASKVYSFLEVEESKLWHFSALTIYNMYEEEQKTGTFVFPEEA